MSQDKSDKERFIRRALALARGQNPAPNPRVGAVVVRGGTVIAEAAHLRAGDAHAEAAALKLAGTEAEGADLYVSLEPCSHSGCGKRRPPCTDAVIRSGIKRVFAASTDANPEVCGLGFDRLRRAGIAVESGILAEEEQYINRDYIHFQKTGRPWIHLKQAVSLDGFISDGGTERIVLSGSEALVRVHRLRRANQAILVGGETVIADNPRLTVRLAETDGGTADNPLRLVLEGRRQVPDDSLVFDTSAAPTILYTGCEDSERLTRLSAAGVDAVVCPGGPSLQAVLSDCGRRGIISVLAEAGAGLAAALLRSGHLNEVSYFYSPKLFGTGLSAAGGVTENFAEGGWKAMPPEQIGCDVLMNWYRRTEAA